MTRGAILRNLRIRKGISQKELACYLKVSVGTVSNYERDRHSPDPDTLCRIADYLGVTTDVLLGRRLNQVKVVPVDQVLSDGYPLRDLLLLMESIPEEFRTCLTQLFRMLGQLFLHS